MRLRVGMAAVIAAPMPSEDPMGESKNPIRIRTGLVRMLSKR
jgi:hypothetical protein